MNVRDEDTFKMLKDRDLLLHYITEYFGERCKTYDRRCPCCKAWKAFDYLTAFMEPEKK